MVLLCVILEQFLLLLNDLFTFRVFTKVVLEAAEDIVFVVKPQVLEA